MRTTTTKKTATTTKKSATKTATEKFTIGIDLGGTKVGAALVDPDGKLLVESVRPTVPPELEGQDPRGTQPPPSPAKVKEHIRYVVDAMAEAVIDLLEREGSNVKAKHLKGIGLASAGPMNLERGTLDFPANFKGWKRVALVGLLEKSLEKHGLEMCNGKNNGCKVHFQNDAMAAALGEGWTGRAAGCSTYAIITVGTGIGTGVILNGKPAQSRGMGSEWGHILVDAIGVDKERGVHSSREVEGVASGTWLTRRAQQRGVKNASTAQLAEAARGGDKVALELFRAGSEALAALLYNLSLGFHLEKIVFSGGMIAIKDCFLPQTVDLYRALLKDKFPEFIAPVQVAKLGTKAGAIGAARMPWLV